jgi:hypothetical protein
MEEAYRLKKLKFGETDDDESVETKPRGATSLTRGRLGRY